MTKYVTLDKMTAEQFITKARRFGWNATSNETLVNPRSNRDRINIAEVNGYVVVVPVSKAVISDLVDRFQLIPESNPAYKDRTDDL